MGLQYLKLTKKKSEDMEHVIPCENLTATACHRMEVMQKGRYGQVTGYMRTSQTKCKQGFIHVIGKPHSLR